MGPVLNKIPFFKQKTVLVLGGGGARGIAHLGVIEYLVQNRISFDAIIGTSAGALFGSLYAMYNSVEKALSKYREVMDEVDLPDFESSKSSNEPGIRNAVRNMYQSIKKSAWVIKGVIRQSLVDKGMFEEILDVYFGDARLEDLTLKTYIVATDLVTGKDIIFSRGMLAPVIQGSSSIAGILPPVDYQGRVLIDGGTTAKLPVIYAVLLGFKRIIAVDVGSIFKENNNFSNAIDIFSRIEKLTSHRFHIDNISLADILIKPQLEDLSWYDFKKTDIIYNRGFSAANMMGPEIKRFSRRIIPGKKYIPAEKVMGFCEII